jgi:carbon-monoxide dehydrogenase large subunit
MIVAGQIHGGVAQGIGQALMECVTYDDSGQPVTGSFMDYALPRAGDIPSMTLSNHPRLQPRIRSAPRDAAKQVAREASLGIVNAVLDALSDEGVTSIDMPLTSEKVWRAIQDGRKAKMA